MVDVDSLNDAERRLIEAVKTGSLCDFSEGEEIHASEMAAWGAERTIRADVLKSLLTGGAADWNVGPNATAVDLCGAIVSGNLSVLTGQELYFRANYCRFEGNVQFDRATFTDYSRFSRSIFSANTSFDDTTFKDAANFSNATFAHPVSFRNARFTGDASFGGCTFTVGAVFDGATFTGRARFENATFTGHADFSSTDFNSATFSGAIFAGEARFSGANCKGGAWFDGVTFMGDAFFSGGAFAGEARFSGANFKGDAWFDRGKFAPDAWFDDGATFTGTARFQDAVFAGEARFSGADFKGDAWFDRGKFAPDAWFDGTAFGGASFDGAKFIGEARFSDAAFTGGTAQSLGRSSTVCFNRAAFTRHANFKNAIFMIGASFDDAKFIKSVSFSLAHFSSGARFDGTTFTGDAEFDDATFKTHALFPRATFNGKAWFQGALANNWGFNSATFSAPDPGPWIGSAVSLERTVLMARGRIDVTASEIEARSLQAPEGAHLVLHSADVDMSDSEFLRRTIIAGRRVAHTLSSGKKAIRDNTPRRQARASAWTEARASAGEEAEQLSKELKEELSSVPPGCALSKLDRSTAGELVLSNVVLDGCTFAGAHDLDEMRIGADCTFRRTRDRSSGDAFTRRRLVTGRRLIAEEIAWRNAHTGPKKHRKPTESKMLAADIAAIYRELRKGLEDAKNEPEAADFYYGEMEMRRLAGRARDDRSDDHRRQAPSIMEHVLLYGYWAVSGYGLRAWRATTMLVVLIVAAALLFSHAGLATQALPERLASINPKDGAVTYLATKPQPPGFLTALNFSARESVSLLHADSASVKTQGAGTLVDFVLRLASPVLLAFIVLALRARTKR
jgi:hypothetical protein